MSAEDLRQRGDERRFASYAERMDKSLTEFAKRASGEQIQKRVARDFNKLQLYRSRHDLPPMNLLPKVPAPPKLVSSGTQFNVSFSGARDGNNIKISKGFYQFGPTGTFTELAATTGTGVKAYFEVTSNWDTSPTCSVLITNDTKSAYELDTGTPQKVLKTFIPIAELIGVDKVLKQYFAGNALFSVWLLQGYAGYWCTNYGLV
jgi:hypothetical protein